MNCEQVKKAGWSLPNWFYGIDPDGPGGNPPFQVLAISTRPLKTCLYKLKLYILKTLSSNSVYLTMVEYHECFCSVFLEFQGLKFENKYYTICK